MLKVALTGGIATGKSHVLDQFRRHGVPCLDADELAHGVTAAGTEATQAIAARFGAGVLAADGAVDRPKMGPIVFADAAARRDLEAIVHPAVYRAIAAGLRAFELVDDAPLAIVDVPLLYSPATRPISIASSRRSVRRMADRAPPRSWAERTGGAAAACRPDGCGRKGLAGGLMIRTDGSFEETNREVERILNNLRM